MNTNDLALRVWDLMQLLTLCCRRTYWRRWKTKAGIKDGEGNRIQAR